MNALPESGQDILVQFSLQNGAIVLWRGVVGGIRCFANQGKRSDNKRIGEGTVVNHSNYGHKKEREIVVFLRNSQLLTGEGREK